MEQQVRRYFIGAVGFAFVVTWATLGATHALVATIVCLAGANVHRLLPHLDTSQARSQPRRRPQRARIATRPLHEEDDRGHRLVPDEPSLIISTQP